MTAELPKVGALRHEDEPEPLPEGFIAQIPVIASPVPRDGLKVRQSGMSKLDIAWENGVLLDTRGLSKACICDLTSDGLTLVEFDSVPSWGVMVAPGMDVPTTEKIVRGREVFAVSMTDVFDYATMERKGPARFVLDTYGHYLILQPIGLSTMPSAKRNERLVKACQTHYEFLEMHPGPGLKTDYCDAFAKRLAAMFDDLDTGGLIWRRRGFQVPFCPWHRRTGWFDPEKRNFRCSRCGRDLGDVEEPPRRVVEEEE